MKVSLIYRKNEDGVWGYDDFQRQTEPLISEQKVVLRKFLHKHESKLSEKINQIEIPDDAFDMCFIRFECDDDGNGTSNLDARFCNREELFRNCHGANGLPQNG